MLSSASGDAGSFHVAANPQLAGNSRPGSNGETRTLVPGFTALNSQTIQWDSWHLSGGTASVPSVYLYDGKNILEEMDNGGNAVARYAQTRSLDEPLGEWRSGTTSYYEQDGLGSVTSLSSSSGALANTYTFDSFGRLTGSTGTLTNPLRYTGREFDSETGLLFQRARYFDPGAGRFLSGDPIGFWGGLNLYAYSRNNPVALTDPLGHQGCSAAQLVQSPNACAGPQGPDAPYEGPDGLWYNVPEWHPSASASADLTPPPGPTPPPPPNCECQNRNLEWGELSYEESLEAMSKGIQIVEAIGDVGLGVGLAAGGAVGGVALCVETGFLGCALAVEAYPAFLVGGYELSKGGLSELDEIFYKDCL